MGFNLLFIISPCQMLLDGGLGCALFCSVSNARFVDRVYRYDFMDVASSKDPQQKLFCLQ